MTPKPPYGSQFTGGLCITNKTLPMKAGFGSENISFVSEKPSSGAKNISFGNRKISLPRQKKCSHIACE
jgi:hypothetical protein